MRGVHAFEARPIDDLYRWFASEAASSPTWQRLCLWIADHPEVNARLDALPGRKRQPNVFLGALRYLSGPTAPGPDFVAWVDAHWAELERVMVARSTQTNEPGRCAVLAPVLASLPQPITLLEVGSSAGLCLLPDRYAYRFSEGDPFGLPGENPGGQQSSVVRPDAAADDAPVLECRVDGTPPGDPATLVVAARRGLDVNPLDAADPDDVRWLRALVWPDEQDREERLAACLALAAADPPEIVTGDLRGAALTESLDALLAAVAPGSTPVLQHSAVLAYLPRAERDAFERAVASAGVRWVSYEGPSVLTSVKARLTDRAAWESTPNFVVALDGEPIGRASAHGVWVSWS